MAAREGYTRLQAKVLEARRVWKRTLLWTGCAIVLAGLVAILAGEAIVDLLMPLPSSIRAVLLIGIIGTAGYFLYRYLIQPLRAELTLHDVALRVEQKHPDLEDRLVSALQFGDRETDDPIEAHMLQRLVTDAAERAEEIDFKATIDKRKKHKHLSIAFAAAAFCVFLTLIFPAEINTTLHRLLKPWEKTEPVFTTKLIVEPGATRILRGQSLAINVEVEGKSADKATLVYTKTDPDPVRELTDQDVTPPLEQQVNMMQIEGEKDKFGYELFNINENMEYYVAANDTASEHYTVEVFDMPKVTAIEVGYTYPEYTQLKPIVQQGDGNIRAVVGSMAEVRIATNKAIQSATLTVEGEAPVPMAIPEGRTLTATLDVLEDGKYTVELLCVDGFKNQTPIEYWITATPDEPPEIVIKEPGRDIEATQLEEVRVVAEATDDYGVEKITLKYSIGSSPAQALPMETVEVEEKKMISGSYTFYIEELDVEPGDVISYYAEATDNNTRTGPGVNTSEIYFIEVRPFNERYEEMEAESGSSPGGQMLAGLVEEQKQIIRETWKHVHTRPRSNRVLRPPSVTDEYQLAVKKTGKKQRDLKDKAQRVVDQISIDMRTASVPPEILMNLEEAIGKMDEASDELHAVKPREAMPPEQDALGLLVKVMMELPKVLARMRAAGNQAAADNMEMDLEELQSAFEEDENKLDEQMREQTQEMLHQAREMLAQQQQLTQQSQQMGREEQPSPREMQQNSQQQGQLAQQAQQMAQRAQQMAQGQGQQSGENNTGQRMGQAGEAMQQTSEQMQQAAENMEQRRPQMSAAKGQKAEENLRRAIDELQKVAAQFTDQALADATRQLDQLIEEQSEVREQTEALQVSSEARSRASEDRTQQDGIRSEDRRRASQLANEQRGLRQDLEQLQHNLTNLQEELNENNSQAARNIGEARREIVEKQAPKNMMSAQIGLQWRNFESAEQNQQEVLDALLQARDALQQARANMAKTEEEQLETALEQLERWGDQMQDIQRELEALDNQGSAQTPEQERRQQQLSELQAQMQQRAQELQQIMEAQQPGQEQQDTQQARSGMDSGREIRELWLGLLDAMNPTRRHRRTPFPNYDFTLRELGKLKGALEDRLAEIQEKKRLAQVVKEDVPPEYRTLVDGYYESLAK